MVRALTLDVAFASDSCLGGAWTVVQHTCVTCVGSGGRDACLRAVLDGSSVCMVHKFRGADVARCYLQAGQILEHAMTSAFAYGHLGMVKVDIQQEQPPGGIGCALW